MMQPDPMDAELVPEADPMVDNTGTKRGRSRSGWERIVAVAALVVAFVALAVGAIALNKATDTPKTKATTVAPGNTGSTPAANGKPVSAPNLVGKHGYSAGAIL